MSRTYKDNIAEENGKYYIKVKVHGQQRQLLAQGANNRDEARAILDAERYKMRQAQAGLIKIEKTLSLKKLFEIYTIYNRNNNKQREPIEKIKAAYSYWGPNKNAKEICRGDIEKWRICLKETKNLSNSTINRYISFLSKSYNLAIADNLLDKNPCRFLKKLEEPRETIKYLTKEEIDKILKVLREEEFKTCKNIVLTAFYTGFRVGNVTKMRWEWLDFKNMIIKIPPKDNKGKKDIEHPLTKALYDIFNEIGIKNSGFVFSNPNTGKPYTNPSRDIVNKIYKKAAVNANGFHIIRHTIATILAQNNISAIALKTFMAHSDLRTTYKYVHQTKNLLLEATDVIDKFMQ